MRYASIRQLDTTNGEGIGISLFVQGCSFHCEGCFNQETWNPNGGKEWTKEIKESFFQLMNRPFIKRVSFLGGDPLYPTNQIEIASLCAEIKQRFPHIKIYLWTGYTLKELLAQNNTVVNSILDKIDVLIDGPFVQEKKDLTLKFRGSSNQHIYIKENNNWKLKE